MRLFARYLYEQKWFMVFVAVLALITASVLYISGTDTDLIIYIMVLIFSVSVVYISAGFYRTWERHTDFTCSGEKSAEDEFGLPTGKTIMEKDFRDAAVVYGREKLQTEEVKNRMYDSMVDYFTMWAHQIKTPISSMRLSLENDDSGTARRYRCELSEIERYVDMVLGFMRLESAETDYLIRQVDVDRVVKGCIRKYSGIFIMKKIGISCRGTERTVLTDEKWLFFIIEQILSNSLKYTSAGTVTIEMNEDDVLSIKDTGAGIRKEDLPRVFEKGYTGYNGRTDMKASGLGLYLVKKACDNLGHRIRIVSQDGAGTEVILDLGHRERIFE